ncbi:LAGLIDADG family homing endonuclease [Candidatus Woesearchaeota archaeon]|nr:LAGLIDADG family homing endonuclease [Candidatus Woesearchaeota archaeon]
MDLLVSLEEIGLDKDRFSSRFFCNKESTNNKVLNELINKFHIKTGIMPSMAFSKNIKGIAFSLETKNTLFTEIVLYSLKKIKNILVEDTSYDANKKRLAEAFIAKLLTGDGSIESRKRYTNSIDVRIKIVDSNKESLKQYNQILTNLGFNGYIYGIETMAYCNIKKLLYLHKISAFKNTKNWDKLINIIRFMNYNSDISI